MESEAISRNVQLTPSPQTTSPVPPPIAASNDLNLEITHFLRHDFYTSHVPFHYDDTDEYFEDF